VHRQLPVAQKHASSSPQPKGLPHTESDNLTTKLTVCGTKIKRSGTAAELRHHSDLSASEGFPSIAFGGQTEPRRTRNGVCTSTAQAHGPNGSSCPEPWDDVAQLPRIGSCAVCIRPSGAKVSAPILAFWLEVSRGKCVGSHPYPFELIVVLGRMQPGRIGAGSAEYEFGKAGYVNR